MRLLNRVLFVLVAALVLPAIGLLLLLLAPAAIAATLFEPRHY